MHRAIVSTENSVVAAEDAIASFGGPAEPFDGRGIVICAGGIKYLPSAWVLIRILRQIGCALPIQVWYRGEQERDDHWIELVRPFGVKCVDAEVVLKLHPHPSLGGWELKPYAALHSSFREVLLLDADNVPVRDPTYLFDAPEYLRHGAIFWPDPEVCRTGPHERCWQAFGVPYRDEPAFESGQLLIDKGRRWRALKLCDWYNQHSYFFYHVVYGDKDTFRFAWHRLGHSFAMTKRSTGDLPCTILQYDLDGELVFQHRHGDKWRLAGNRQVPGFVHEAECFQFIAELDALWNPLATKVRRLTVDSRAQMHRLASHPSYQFALVGRRRWPISLAKDGRIVGAGPMERYWWSDDDRVFIAGFDGHISAILIERSDGSWLGRTSLYGGAAVRLVKSRERCRLLG